MSMMKVAQLAGVSYVTVSRVLNDQPGVSEKTARDVRRIVAELGYTPRPDRRRRNRRPVPRDTASITLGLIVLGEICPLHATFVQELLQGAESICQNEGHSLLFFRASTPGPLARFLKQHPCQGLLLVGEGACPWLTEVIGDLPNVWLTSHALGREDVVLSGNELIGRLAARYLLDRGHRNLAFLATEADNPSHTYRGEMFAYAATAQGATCDTFVSHPNRTAQCPTPTLETIEARLAEQIDRLVTHTPRPTGVFLPSDLLAALAYRHLRRHGLEPGRDIDLIAVDNEAPYRAGLYPRPATIDIGARSRGERGVAQLLWQIRYPDQTRGVQIVIEPLLIQGEPAQTLAGI